MQYPQNMIISANKSSSGTADMIASAVNAVDEGEINIHSAREDVNVVSTDLRATNNPDSKTRHTEVMYISDPCFYTKNLGRSSAVEAPIDPPVAAHALMREFRLEVDKKKVDTVHSSALVATPIPQAITYKHKRDLETLIRDLLPLELKIMVLKEYVALWDTDLCTTPDFPYFKYKKFPKYRYTNTRRAILVCSGSSLDSKAFSNIQIGWCALPIHRHGFSARRWLEIAEQGEILASYGLPTLDPNPFEILQISNILEPVACSKTFYPILRRFFFGHITWIFLHADHMCFLIEGTESQPNPTILKSMKSICLEINSDGHRWLDHESSWSVFINLFEYAFNLLTRPDSLLPGIKTLEIYSQGFDPKAINRKSKRVIDEKTRVKYLVTRCYLLAKSLPNIKILLKGVSGSTATKLNPNKYPTTNQHRIRRLGLGYSKKRVDEFLNTRHQLRLPSLELLKDDVENAYSPDEYESCFKEEIQWQILFVEEWKKIWELGLMDSDNEDGYEGVENPELTLDDDESDDDDDDDWSSDSEEEDVTGDEQDSGA